MPLPPGMEWNNEDITLMYWARDNITNNITNGSDTVSLNFTGATIASPIIMFVTGVVGNLLALTVLHRTRLESQRLMFHSLVAGLVWNDLIGIVLTSPVTLASYFNGLQMPGGEHLCRFNGFIMVCFGLSTPLIVSAMAIERFLFVKYTFYYTKHCAPGAARFVMLMIWAFVLFFGLLPLFGFGNYVLQYPRTWCFLDFRTRNLVHATYGYIYSSLNLLLVVVMVICNLVVVVTLARVRDYRRKYSNSSVNSNMMIGDVMDDTQRQQVVKRRKQKDMELQMIVVMCAITTIFAICWAPLMIYIAMSLATGGQTADVLGLVAIRLASLNQTLNPWLYVILRRALIVRIKKYCCMWRRNMRSRSNPSPATAGRRHQYVHVRNQLCHRSNFVGAEVKDDLQSHRSHRSRHQILPAAMSLPDIMIIDTGRKDLSMLLPDVVKAESFAGRISHSYSLDSLLNYVYCPSPAVDGCVACLIEKCATSGKNGKAPEAASNHDCSGHQNNSKVKGANKNIMMKNGKKVNNKGEITTEDHPRSKIQSGRGDDAHGVSVGACSEHSPINFQNDHQASPVSRSDPLGKKNCERIVSASSSSKSGSFRRGWTREFQLSQHVHKLRDGSRSSSSKTSSSKCHPLSYQSSSGDSSSLKTQKSKRLKLRINPADSNSHERDHNEQFIDGISYSGVFRKREPNLCLETQHDTLTTDQADFSSKLTESMYITDTPMATPVVRSFTINRDPFINKLKNGQDIGVVDFDHQEDTTQKKQHCVGHGDASNSGDITKADILSTIQTSSDENRMTVGTDNNQACSVNLSNSHSCLLKEDSEDESDESSGIFCGRSPGHRRRDMTIKPNRQLKKETQSELAQECSTDEKHIARRVKSNT